LLRLIFIIVVVSYLLGSIPFGYLLVRMFRGEDVRHTGSGNIGATNVARTGSKWLAIATLLLDALKGYLAVFVAGNLVKSSGMFFTVLEPGNGGRPSTLTAVSAIATLCALAALVAIAGHMFPVWLRFKGGKGVATAAGAFGALSPRAMLLALAAFALVVALTRYVSLGSMVAAATFPFFARWTTPPDRTNFWIAGLMGASSLLIIMRHKSNIRRLITGTEHRFR
jgi:glycerol-3-phosphate acyltransferase PlsY